MARSRKEKDEEELPHAFVLGGAAGLCAFFAVTQPWLWWLLFPAFGFGMGAASAVANTMKKRKAAALLPAAPASAPLSSLAPPPALPDEPAVAAIRLRLARVDDVCRSLLAELKTAPAAARELVVRPEETIEALRKASHEMGRRESDLRSAATPAEEARLKGEKAALEARIEVEEDAVVRERLASAAGALDEQLGHRAGLARSAARIEAEATRILYALESLRAQVLRASAADSTAEDVAGAGLRDSLAQLGREMDAVAAALEEVHAPEAASPVPPTAASASGPTQAAHAPPHRPAPLPQSTRG